MSLRQRLTQLERQVQAQGSPDAYAAADDALVEALDAFDAGDEQALHRMPPAPKGWLETRLREAAAAPDHEDHDR